MHLHALLVIVQNIVDTHLCLLYLMILLSAVFEGLPIIGVVYPGTTMIILLSSLITMSKLNLWLILLIAFLGGFIGDYLAYMAGITSIRKIEERVKEEKKMWKYSKKFFERYGVASIILGRFISITRSFIPYIAGMSKMNNKYFVLANIVSSSVWAIFHVLLGYFAGKNWEVALKNLDKTLAVFVVVVLIYILIKMLYLRKIEEDNLDAH